MFRKYLSFQHIISSAASTFLRFPWVLCTVFVGVFSTLLLINFKDIDNQLPYLPYLVLTVSLGLTLFLSIKLYGEERGWLRPQYLKGHLVGLCFLLVYFYSWYPYESKAHAQGAKYFTFFLLNVSLHLAVSFAPFVKGRGLLNAFWQYNRMLFLRISTAILYSVILYAGLAIAIAAFCNLFSIKIDEKFYFSLWVIVTGIFNTWFFLGGVPQGIKGLEGLEDYPKGLQVLTQYILIPIATLYFLILYMYMGKIIWMWSLPKGWVSVFIITASMLGILAILLIYPVSQRKEGGWVRVYARSFYFAIFPLIVLLVVAIGRRVIDYGITEKRYFVIAFALWLFFIALYFILSKQRNIKIVPMSLFLVLFLSAFGPWGASEVSRRSQFKRLEGLLLKNKVLVSGVVQKEHPDISFDERREICSILTYFYNNHGYKDLRPWFPPSGSFKDMNYIDIAKEMGIEYVYPRSYEDSGWFSYNAYQQKTVTDIRGYDYLMDVNIYSTVESIMFSASDLPAPLEIVYDPKAHSLTVRSSNKEPIQWDLKDFLERLQDNYGYGSGIPGMEDLKLEGENGWIKVKFYFTSIYGSREDGGNYKINTLAGKMLVSFKDGQ